jgi:hypothetical protein
LNSNCYFETKRLRWKTKVKNNLSTRGRRRLFVSLVARPQIVMSRSLGFSLAMSHDFSSVLRGTPIPGIVIYRKATNDVSKFVEQNGDLCFRSIPRVRGDYQRQIARRARSSTPEIRFKDWRAASEECTIGVQNNGGIASRILNCSCSPRMFEAQTMVLVP